MNINISRPALIITITGISTLAALAILALLSSTSKRGDQRIFLKRLFLLDDVLIYLNSSFLSLFSP